MKLIDIAQVLQTSIQGTDVAIQHIMSDSRLVKPGDLFIAIPGEHVDGHDYILAAKQAGAVAVIVAKAYQNNKVLDDLNVIYVEDTLMAYGKLAAWYRKFFHPMVIAVTGSCGKTTTKVIIEHILQQHGHTLASQKSYNNHLGVPLTLCQLDDSYDYYVQELGANHPGEIAPLSGMVQPHVAVITNIAPAHMEGFGSIERLIETKLGILAGLDGSGSIILNADNEYIAKLKQKSTAKHSLTFGIEHTADIMAKDIQFQPLGSTFRLCTPHGDCDIQLQMPGKHNIMNTLAAAAAGCVAGIPLKVIQQGIHSVQSVERRMRVYRSIAGCHIIDDSYNSNPGAVIAAIDVLSAWPGQHYLVMGSMLELGKDSEKWHLQVARYALEKGINKIYCYGVETRCIVDNLESVAQYYDSKFALLESVQSVMQEGVTILVKGSNSLGLHEVVAGLVDDLKMYELERL